ncbi:aldehyde dehydrogenase family protein, partial [Motilibacter deserti]
MAIAVTNPATGEVLETFEEHDGAQIEERLAKAVTAYQQLRSTSFALRAQWLRAAADVLDREADDIARDMVLEMGKPITAAKAEVAKCAKGMRFYAEHAERFLADEPLDAEAVGASRAFTRYQPLGPVLAVMPWNFPLWQVVRFMAPALMAGNVGLLKHSSNVPRTALRLERVAREAGFPDGAFQTLLVSAKQVEQILRDPR